MMKKGILVIIIFLSLSVPLTCAGDENAIVAGYGFGFLNLSPKFGKLRGDNGEYYFYQIAYAREKLLGKGMNLLIEPFVAYETDPKSGVDMGCMFSLKHYFGEDKKNSLFATLGTGAAYTTIKFEEQGSHLLFILQGGIGYRWDQYFIENRFRHYSNAGLEKPNRSINANIVNIGMHF